MSPRNPAASDLSMGGLYRIVGLLATFALAGECAADESCDKVADGSCVEAAVAAPSDGDVTTTGLPPEAQKRADALRVEMRFFLSVGLAAPARERELAIIDLFSGHGLDVPEHYQSW